ncbi:MAG: hypothetical protein WCV67_03040 [Victivallaceae bacterium]
MPKRLKPKAAKLDKGYYPWSCGICKGRKFKVGYTRKKQSGQLRKLICCNCQAVTYTGEQILQPWKSVNFES